jgi:hypothetical protein
MFRRTPLLVFALAPLLLFMPTASATHNADRHSANMSLVKTLTYQLRNGGTSQRGADIEFGRLGSPARWYAFAGTYFNGLQIVDIAWPPRAQIVGVYDCAVQQGDVQVFKHPNYPGRTFVTYTSDTTPTNIPTATLLASACYRDAAALGFTVTKPNGTAANGTFIADVTDPRNPFTVSFINIAKGSHNQTVHPSGRYLYNSNSDLVTSTITDPAIEIFDITDIYAPRFVRNLPLPVRPGLASESHDITFTPDGKRAYSAAISQTHILNTENPENPSIISSIFDPTVNVSHGAEPFSAIDPMGMTRNFLIVGDEFAGAVGTGQCPNGGLHIYDITDETQPEKVGFWVIDEIGPTFSPTDSCTAHMFMIHHHEEIMTISFYNGGTRVVDVSEVAGLSVGDNDPAGGMREIGFYRPQNANTWASKTPFIDPRSGDFWVYSNDIRRGLDIFHFDADGQNNFSVSPGQNMSPSQAEAFMALFPLLAPSEQNPTYDIWLESKLNILGF